MGASAGRMDPSSEPTTPSASSASASTVTTGELPSRRSSPLSDDASLPSVKRKRLAFETPREGQRVTLLDMPEEILMEIIMNLDVDALSKCYRVSSTPSSPPPIPVLGCGDMEPHSND